MSRRPLLVNTRRIWAYFDVVSLPAKPSTRRFSTRNWRLLIATPSAVSVWRSASWPRLNPRASMKNIALGVRDSGAAGGLHESTIKQGGALRGHLRETPHHGQELKSPRPPKHPPKEQ